MLPSTWVLSVQLAEMTAIPPKLGTRVCVWCVCWALPRQKVTAHKCIHFQEDMDAVTSLYPFLHFCLLQCTELSVPPPHLAPNTHTHTLFYIDSR